MAHEVSLDQLRGMVDSILAAKGPARDDPQIWRETVNAALRAHPHKFRDALAAMDSVTRDADPLAVMLGCHVVLENIRRASLPLLGAEGLDGLERAVRATADIFAGLAWEAYAARGHS